MMEIRYVVIRSAIFMAMVISVLSFGSMMASAAEPTSLASPDFLGALFFGFSALCIIAPILIRIILAIWTYKDATKRGENSPALWLLIVLILGIIGLIIYLIVRPKEPKKSTMDVPPPPPPPA